MAELLHDLVERRRHRRQGGELLDQGIALLFRLLADDGVAVGVGGGPAHQVALVVGEGLLELDREGAHQERQDAVPRGEVDIEVVPLRGRDFGDAPLLGRERVFEDVDLDAVIGHSRSHRSWPSQQPHRRAASLQALVKLKAGCPVGTAYVFPWKVGTLVSLQVGMVADV